MARKPDESDKPDEEEPLSSTVYALRMAVRAERDINQALLHLAEGLAGGLEVGEKLRAWRDGLQELIQHLSVFPRTYAHDAAFSRRVKQEVRRAVYRRPGAAPSSVAYHVYFSVVDEGPDGPLVTVIHVRHAARHSPTAAEVADILAEQ